MRLLFPILTLSFLLACGAPSEGHDRKVPTPQGFLAPYGEVWVDGILHVFPARVTHAYDQKEDRTVVAAYEPDTTEWTVFVQWTGDLDPETFSSDVDGGLEVWLLETGTGAWWAATYPMANLATAEVTRWSPAGSGGQTDLTFQGTVALFSDPTVTRWVEGSLAATRLP